MAPYFFALLLSQTFVLFRLEVPCHPVRGKWLYVPMSIGRFKRVRSGIIDLRDAFLNAEDGFIYEVILPCDDSFDRVIAVYCQELNDEWLPVAGELLNFGSKPLPALLLQKQEARNPVS